jgi:hypothetical protein
LNLSNIGVFLLEMGFNRGRPDPFGVERRNLDSRHTIDSDPDDFPPDFTDSRHRHPCLGGKLQKLREADSPKRVTIASKRSSPEVTEFKSTTAPLPVLKQLSAIVTAIPPSEQS